MTYVTIWIDITLILKLIQIFLKNVHLNSWQKNKLVYMIVLILLKFLLFDLSKKNLFISYFFF